MERLIERFMYYCGLLIGYLYVNKSNLNIAEVVDDMKHIQNLLDAEEQGLLLRLPCKVGTTYWTFDTQYWIEEEKCRGCEYYYDCDIETFCDCNEDYPKCTQIVGKVFLNNLEIVSLMNQFGKSVFLTKAEAEQKLAEMGGE